MPMRRNNRAYTDNVRRKQGARDYGMKQYVFEKMLAARLTPQPAPPPNITVAPFGVCRAKVPED